MMDLIATFNSNDSIKCHYADCRIFIAMLWVLIMLTVLMLSIIMQNVVMFNVAWEINICKQG
jgi:hypothetical protein